MNFKQRLKLYLVGVFFGLIVVYFSLIKNRDRNLGAWLPENRVLAQLDSVQLNILPELTNCIICLNLNQQEIKKLIINSKVNFKQSNTENKEKPLYLLEGKLKSGEEFNMILESYPNKSILKKITLINYKGTCNCN